VKKSLHAPTRTTEAAPASSESLAPLSSSTVALHARALIATVARFDGGRLDRAAAERLAARTGGRISALLDAGFWTETETGYVVRAGALTAWSDRTTE
jgi:hypothetical protein